MATSVTIHRTTTTTTSSAVLVNVGYVKTMPGILKALQILIGCVVVGIVGHYIQWSLQDYRSAAPELFFLLIATACLITTTLLLVACAFSFTTASLIPKTLFETLYHVVAALLYLACSLCLVIQLSDRRSYNYEAKMAAGMVAANGAFAYLLLCCSINLLSQVVARNQAYKISERGYGSKIFSGSLGLVNTILYIIGSVYSVRSFRKG